MRLPELQGIQTMVSDLNVFNGINDNVYIPEGSFKDMKNMSSDYYPALRTKKKQGKVRHIRKYEWGNYSE